MAKRIAYIDYLRGLSVTWVVWYHTTHPEFVDFPFRIPLFFFVSGIFFKAYSIEVFCKKKINQLIVPFVLFYLLYYIFLIITWYGKYHTMESFEYSHILDVFGLYSNNGSFTVNPPLWFICSLINLQVLLYVLHRLIKNRWYILLIAAAVSLFDLFYFKDVPTPFMISRSLQYFIYYVAGYICGKALMYYMEESKSSEYKVLGISLIVFTVFLVFDLIIGNDNLILKSLNYYPMIFAVIAILMVFFKEYSSHWIFRPLMFFGVNSYVVLGMHEMYHTTLRIIIENHIGEIDVWLGALQTVITLLLLWPTILIFNRYIPKFVAKKELIPIPKDKP